jgi:hypothetical protein
MKILTFNLCTGCLTDCILTHYLHIPMIEFYQMMKTFLSTITIMLISSAAAACSPRIAPDPSAEPISSLTATSSDGLPYGCHPEVSLLDNLRAQLSYQQAAVIYQAYAGEHSLVIWLAAPELSGGYPAENQHQATEIAISSAEVLMGASVCVQKFDLLHITVVGADYTQWFSGSIRPADLLSIEDGNTGGGVVPERGAGVLPGTAELSDPPLASDCDWPSVKASLDQQTIGEEIEADYYFIRDSNASLVFAHWVLPADNLPEDQLPLLAQMTEQLTCLYPRPTGLSMTIAGEDGVVRLTGFIPGKVSRKKTSFDLDDLSYQLLEAP